MLSDMISILLSISGENTAIGYWLRTGEDFLLITNLDVLHCLGHGDPLDAGLPSQLFHHHSLLLDARHCALIRLACSESYIISLRTEDLDKTNKKQTFYLVV